MIRNIKIEVIVKPTTGDGAKNGNGTAKINVFKPELTFKDSEAKYGEQLPANNNYSDNKIGVEWKPGETISTGVEMIGSAPTLNITYSPDEETFDKENNKYTNQDVAGQGDCYRLAILM